MPYERFAELLAEYLGQAEQPGSWLARRLKVGDATVSGWLRRHRQAVALTTPGPYRAAVSAAIQERLTPTKPKELPSYKQLP